MANSQASSATFAPQGSAQPMARQERESGVCSASEAQTGWSVADGSTGGRSGHNVRTLLSRITGTSHLQPGRTVGKHPLTA
jgi:hypothetical protein